MAYGADMTTYANPVRLEFEKANIGGGGFHLSATVAGVATNCFQVDTGSSGMVMSQSLFPSDFDFSKYPNFGTYTIHYYPSTNSHTGTWYYLPVELTGKDGSVVHTHAMVLVCSNTPDSVAMMGVSAKGEDPSYNAFLNAYTPGENSHSSVPFAPSYVLNGDAVIIGQTHSASDGFAGATLTVVNPPLTPLPKQQNNVPFTQSGVSAWNPPNVTLTVTAPPEVIATNANATISQTLAFEMDTGIDQFLVACPQDELPAGCLADENQNKQWPFFNDTQITVNFPASVNPGVLNYTFTVGQKPPAQSPAPLGNSIYMGPASPPQSFSRANVGICPLLAYSYMYDALNGFLGFKPN